MENKLLNLSAQDREILLQTLDKWIGDSEKNCEIFENADLEILRKTSKASGTAFWMVKQFIEINS